MATTTTTTTPTGWAADAAFSNWQRAQQIAAQPFTPYTGNMLAGWNTGQQQGYNAAVNGGGVGQQAQALGQQFATQAGQYQPQQINAGGYAPNMQGVMNTAAATAGPAAQTTAAQMQAANAGPAVMRGVMNTAAANAGPAALMNASSMTAANAGPAATMNAASMHAASAGPAQQAAAAQMGRGDVRDVAAGNFTQANLNSYMNPYIGSVVNSTLGQLGRQNDILQSQSNAKAAAAGAFGGGRQAVMNAENNRAFLDTAGQVTSNLYNQGFNTAQQAIQSDQNRALQAGQANQQADLSVGQANLANRQNTALQNMLQGNQMSQFNAGNQQQANLQNAGFAQSAAANNQAAQNQMAALNSGYQQNANLQNSNLAQAASANNQAAQNNMAALNSGYEQTSLSNTAAAHNTALADQANAANNMSQYNAGLQQAANAANAGYTQGTGQFNANALNNMAQYNTTNQQSAYTNTAAAHNTALANQAAAANAAGQFNSELGYKQQLANQLAGQQATNSQLTAANYLNGMGLDQQKQYLNSANAQMGAGNAMTTQDQAALTNAYNQWAAQQNYPGKQLGILQQGLNGYNSGQATATPYYSNTGANVLAGGLGIGSLLANGSAIAGGTSALYNGLSGLWSGASSMPNSIADAGAMSGADLLSDYGSWF